MEAEAEPEELVGLTAKRLETIAQAFQAWAVLLNRFAVRSNRWHFPVTQPEPVRLKRKLYEENCHNTLIARIRHESVRSNRRSKFHRSRQTGDFVG